MKVSSLQKLRGLKPELIPPKGAKPVGVHDDGRVIYEMRKYDVEASMKAKTQKIDSDGKPVFKKHATTGEELYPVYEAHPQYRTSRFVLKATPNGHVRMEEHFEQSREERNRDERTRERNEFSADLAQEATKRGMSAQELVSRVLDKIEGPKDAIQFPFHHGGGHWELSNGARVRGNKESAELAEAAIHVALPVEDELIGDEEEDGVS